MHPRLVACQGAGLIAGSAARGTRPQGAMPRRTCLSPTSMKQGDTWWQLSLRLCVCPNHKRHSPSLG
eukprot:4349459-Amphidinium_carterae.1